jgi:FixJ family two-component response regulator
MTEGVTPSLGREDFVSIVDDDESFRGAMTRFIRSLGHSVAAFSSAEEFLTSNRLHDTTCLISDVQMPGMSGIELQDRLLADGYRLPIIFVAADPESNARGRALASGALGFLTKPFSEEVLVSCLERALSGRKA